MAKRLGTVFGALLVAVGIQFVSNFSRAAGASDPYVYTTEHQGYTCERWGGKGYKLSAFEEELNYKFVSLDVSKSTRKARINVVNTENGCQYTAYFTRQKGNTYVAFESSEVSDSLLCQAFKEDMDDFMSLGWDYKIKLNKYLSVKFQAEIESKCTPVTGESYARFIYTL